MHFAGLMTVFGAAAFLALLRACRIAMPPERTLYVLFPAAAGLSFLTGGVWLLLVVGNMAGDWRAGFNASMLSLVTTSTEFGRIALWRLVGLVLLFALSLGRVTARPKILALVSALLLAALGLTSHAAAAAGALPMLRAAGDALHLLTAGFWVGGLAMLAVIIARDYDDPQKLIAPFRLFSRFGTVAVALLVTSGIANAMAILPVNAMSPRNAYADLLAFKIALALSMIALATTNRFQLVPAIGFANGGVVRQLRYSVFAEIALGALVIAVVGYLGQMAPG